MTATDQATGERARLLGLLRLADRGSNGFPNERQVALQKALAVARRGAIAMEDLLEAHRLDVSDLSGPRWWIPREGSAAALRYPFLVSRYGPEPRGQPSRE